MAPLRLDFCRAGQPIVVAPIRMVYHEAMGLFRFIGVMQRNCFKGPSKNQLCHQMREGYDEAAIWHGLL